MPNPDTTVLFAARNSELVLRRTLEACSRAEKPCCGWKLVFVDSRSTDCTLGIVELFMKPTAARRPAVSKKAKRARVSRGDEQIRNGLGHDPGKLDRICQASSDGSGLSQIARILARCLPTKNKEREISMAKDLRSKSALSTCQRQIGGKSVRQIAMSRPRHVGHRLDRLFVSMRSPTSSRDTLSKRTMAAHEISLSATIQ